MQPVNSSQMPPVDFDVRAGSASKKLLAPANQIKWLHSMSDKPGARFDITIRDGLGRERFSRKGWGSEHDRAGELVGLETSLGEELDIEISNVKGADSVKLFLN